eukprot:TRINITY_DN19097_c0_g1_i1.p1 TRINITY_DN19097_c0_g1~~TRINITY_DN19097_c0_g1_i1.p1  ORF type:complete len:406 (+),score=23.61 TRINITY_DN19097_c0_g1_i1:3-1220(+)
MSKDKSWGDHLCLVAAVEIFGLDIYILTSSNTENIDTPNPTEDQKMMAAWTKITPFKAKARSTIYLFVVDDWHYGVLIPKEKNADTDIHSKQSIKIPIITGVSGIGKTTTVRKTFEGLKKAKSYGSVVYVRACFGDFEAPISLMELKQPVSVIFGMRVFWHYIFSKSLSPCWDVFKNLIVDSKVNLKLFELGDVLKLIQMWEHEESRSEKYEGSTQYTFNEATTFLAQKERDLNRWLESRIKNIETIRFNKLCVFVHVDEINYLSEKIDASLLDEMLNYLGRLMFSCTTSNIFLVPIFSGTTSRDLLDDISQRHYSKFVPAFFQLRTLDPKEVEKKIFSEWAFSGLQPPAQQLVQIIKSVAPLPKAVCLLVEEIFKTGREYQQEIRSELHQLKLDHLYAKRKGDP